MAFLDLTLKKSQCTRGQWRLLKSTEKVVLLSGGFGSGKTLGLGLKLLQLKDANPNVPGLLLAQTWRALWSTTYRRLMGFLRRTLPRKRLPRLVDKTGECYLDFGDGIPIFLRSAHDPGSYDGLDVGYALGDEARHWPSRESFDVLLGRVRTPCPLPQTVLVSTPSLGWMADEFDAGKSQRQLIVSPTIENERNLAPGFIDNLRLSYSRRLQKAVIEGKFTVLEGAVYEAFDNSTDSEWVTPYFPEDHLSRFTTLMVDPGYRNSSWVWAHEVGPAEWVVFDQLSPERTSDESAVLMVNDRGWPIDEIWVDPAADQTQSAMDLDTIDMMQSIKMRSNGEIKYIVPPFNRIPYGVDKARTLLGDPDIGQPIRVRFSESLVEAERGQKRGIAKDLATYRYPEVKEDKPITDHPLKDGRTDHGCDAFRNWAVGQWLTNPTLRDMLDRAGEHEVKEGKPGYRIAHN